MKRSMLSSMDALMFLRLKGFGGGAEDRHLGGAHCSRAFVALFVGHQYRIGNAGTLVDAANTSAASASCGIHFGLTKLVASIVRSPVPRGGRSIRSWRWRR